MDKRINLIQTVLKSLGNKVSPGTKSFVNWLNKDRSVASFVDKTNYGFPVTSGERTRKRFDRISFSNRHVAKAAIDLATALDYNEEELKGTLIETLEWLETVAADEYIIGIRYRIWDKSGDLNPGIRVTVQNLNMERRSGFISIPTQVEVSLDDSCENLVDTFLTAFLERKVALNKNIAKITKYSSDLHSDSSSSPEVVTLEDLKQGVSRLLRESGSLGMGTVTFTAIEDECIVKYAVYFDSLTEPKDEIATS